MRWPLLALALAACSEPPVVQYLVVEIAARPAVHDVATLKISLTNESRSNGGRHRGARDRRRGA
jgi:hypothetical protein